jgi:hypothetical protein
VAFVMRCGVRIPLPHLAAQISHTARHTNPPFPSIMRLLPSNFGQWVIHAPFAPALLWHQFCPSDTGPATRTPPRLQCAFLSAPEAPEHRSIARIELIHPYVMNGWSPGIMRIPMLLLIQYVRPTSILSTHQFLIRRVTPPAVTIPRRLSSHRVRACGISIFVIMAALPPSLASSSVAPFSPLPGCHGHGCAM